ncbi:hypothetical protein C8J56DRAFT_1166340 [Mycena floridula]|nr:hypothetical protein C8J56DRAFT_1166340 [Mycena floridula]
MDSTDAIASFPELPIELVFLIVEKLLEISPKRTLRFLLLSRTIKPIVEKALYHTIILNSKTKADLFVQMLDSGCRPDSFYRLNVRTLCVSTRLRLSVLISLFSACTGAQTIGVFGWNTRLETDSADISEAVLDALASSGPQPPRLSVEWNWCLRNHRRFSLPLFQNVTHLQLDATNTPILFFEPKQLGRLTKLTHLSLIPDPMADSSMAEFVACLSLSDSIQICIVSIYCIDTFEVLESARMCSKDPRVVFAVDWYPKDMENRPESILERDLLNLDEWVRQWGQGMSKTEMDIWEEAENIVAVQRALKAAG